jgi:hypothetical protein
VRALKKTCDDGLFKGYQVVWKMSSISNKESNVAFDEILRINSDQWTLSIDPYMLEAGATYNISATSSRTDTLETWTIHVIVEVLNSPLIPRIFGCDTQVNPTDWNSSLSGCWSMDPDAANLDIMANFDNDPRVLSKNLDFRWEIEEFDNLNSKTGISFNTRGSCEVNLSRIGLQDSFNYAVRMYISDVSTI